MVLGMIALFWANPIWVGILIAFGAFLLELVIDNIAARMTAGWMVRLSWTVGLILGILILPIYISRRGYFKTNGPDKKISVEIALDHAFR